MSADRRMPRLLDPDEIAASAVKVTPRCSNCGIEVPNLGADDQHVCVVDDDGKLVKKATLVETTTEQRQRDDEFQAIERAKPPVEPVPEQP